MTRLQGYREQPLLSRQIIRAKKNAANTTRNKTSRALPSAFSVPLDYRGPTKALGSDSPARLWSPPACATRQSRPAIVLGTAFPRTHHQRLVAAPATLTLSLLVRLHASRPGTLQPSPLPNSTEPNHRFKPPRMVLQQLAPSRQGCRRTGGLSLFPHVSTCTSLLVPWRWA